MVQTFIDDGSRTGRIILKPNASWTWRANMWLLYTLMGVSFTIAIAFLLRGVWLVLPYTTLEMTALFVCLYYCVRQCHRQEVITVSEHEVHVERGYRHPEEQWHYHRLWAKFMVKKPRHPWRRVVVSIRSHGEELEIGSFLNDPDKQVLVKELKRVVPA